MSKKSLILYASRTGNTEKVALRLKDVFERHGWQCDLLKIDKSTVIDESTFDCTDYDFLCVGSYVDTSLPSNQLIEAMRHNPLDAHHPPPANIDMKDRAAMLEWDKISHARIILGPDDKRGIVFATYGGYHFGPKEAEPALKLMELEMEHMRFVSLGTFACPGKFLREDLPNQYFKNLTKRPDERDLRKAEIFMEEILEEIE